MLSDESNDMPFEGEQFLAIFTLLRIHPFLEPIHLYVDTFLLSLFLATCSKVD